MFDHRPVSLSDQVFDKLEGDILSGVYQRGTILTELSLCASLGVSRTPVREALKMLESEHLIEETAKGTVVIGITNDDIQDIFDIRYEIEGKAAELAAERITDDQLSELKETLDLQDYYAAKGDSEHVRAADSRFHELLYRASGSMIYYSTLMPLHKKSQRYRKLSVEKTNRAPKSCLEHRAIYEALASHDPAAARRASEEHIKNAAYNIFAGDKD